MDYELIAHEGESASPNGLQLVVHEAERSNCFSINILIGQIMKIIYLIHFLWILSGKIISFFANSVAKTYSQNNRGSTKPLFKRKNPPKETQ